MMSHFPVSDAKLADLAKRMVGLGLKESDLEEQFVRGGGAGGQKINKTSVVVWLKHVPSGIEVRCQESRSQALNRFLARRLLVEKLEYILFKEKSAKEQAIAKIRRQKRRRSKRAREKMFQDKKFHAEKKKSRGRPSPED